MKKLLGLFAVAPLTLAACTVKEEASTPEVEAPTTPEVEEEEGFDFENTTFDMWEGGATFENVVIKFSIFNKGADAKAIDALGQDFNETTGQVSTYFVGPHDNCSLGSDACYVDIEVDKWYVIKDITTKTNQTFAIEIFEEIDYTLPSA